MKKTYKTKSLKSSETTNNKGNNILTAFMFLLLLILPMALFYITYSEEKIYAKDIFVDKEKNLYFVQYTSDNIEILKTSQSGELLGKYVTERYLEYDFSELYDITFDENNNAYLSFVFTDSRDFSLTAHKIVAPKWSSSSLFNNKGKVIQSLSYKDSDILKPVTAEIEVNGNVVNSLICFDTGYYFSVKTEIDSGLVIENNRVETFEKMRGVNFLQDDLTVICDNLGRIYKENSSKNYTNIYKETQPRFNIFKTDLNKKLHIYVFSEKKWYTLEDDNTFLPSEIKTKGYEGSIAIIDSKNYAILEDSGYAARLFSDGNETKIPLPVSNNFLINIIIAAGVGIVLSGIYAIVCYILKRKKVVVSLIIKQTGIIIITFSIMLPIIALLIFTMINEYHKYTAVFTLRKTTAKYSLPYKYEDFSKIDFNNLENDSFYQRIKNDFSYHISHTDLIEFFSDGSTDVYSIDENHYIGISIPKDGEFYTLYYDNLFSGVPISYYFDTTVSKECNELLKHPETKEGFIVGFNDTSSEYISVIAPVKNQDGEIIALVEAGCIKREFLYNSSLDMALIMILFAIFGGFTLIFIIIGLIVSLFPLRKLHKAIIMARDGDYKTIPVRGNTEISNLTLAFNDMSKRTDERKRELENINQSYYRFIPEEIFEKMEKENIFQVQAGDFKEDFSYILNISIKNSDEIIKKQSSNEVFSLWGNLYSEITKVVIKRGGFCEFMGYEELVCIFNNKSESLKAAVEIIKNSEDLNSQKDENIQITAILTAGNVIYGTLGYEKHLKIAVFSEYGKIVNTLSKLAEELSVKILFMENAVSSGYSRYMGQIEAEEDGKFIKLYECYEADSERDFYNKNKFSKIFEEGVLEFEKENFINAKLLFIKYLKAAAPDPAALRYLSLCDKNTLLSNKSNLIK